jgi:protein-S-isoprenylcysteine O-methyltransferase Ste14
MCAERASRALIRGWGRPVTSEGRNVPRRRHIVRCPVREMTKGLHGWDAFKSTKFYDVAVAAPFLAFYVFALSGVTARIAQESPALMSGRWNTALLLDFLLNIVTALYVAMTISAVIIRKMPVAKSEGVKPRLIALIGANLQMSFFALPRAIVSVPVSAVSLIVATLGIAAELAVLARLRRSFSILPEARELVTSGPYRWIRHPLYLTGTITGLGLCLQFEQPWGLLITLATFGFQLWRMHYEETVLTRAFPAYAAYARKTARLIPGIY